MESNDTLLFTISAKKDMSWPVFKEAYAYLQAAQAGGGDTAGEPQERNRAVEGLESLGHCDFYFGRDTWRVYAGPPLLARLPQAGLPAAVLAGARLPGTRQRLEEAVKKYSRQVRMRIEPQPHGWVLMPDRIVVEADSLEILDEFARSLKIAFPHEPPAWSLLHFAASLEDVSSGLAWTAASELNWVRKDFDVQRLIFRPATDDGGGVRLSRYTSPVDTTFDHYLYRDGQQAEVDVNWGRFLALKAYERWVLWYDERRFILAVPATVPLPRLLARCMVLSSGYLPVQRPSLSSRGLAGINMLYYRWIPPQIASLAARKLGQRLLECSLDILFEGASE